MRSFDLKRAVVALALGAATLALGGLAVSSVAAQQTPTPTPSPSPRQAPPTRTPDSSWQERHEQYLAALAKRLNVSVDQLKKAMEEARQELGLPEQPSGPHRGGPGRGPGGQMFETAARAIGISADQLRQELPGKSLADVARAHNVNPSKVADALKSEARSHIDQAASAGRIPADKAAEIKQNLDARIDEMINKQVPADAPRRGGPGQRPAGAPFERGPQQGPASGFFQGGPRL